ncbi:molybdate ABC transporter substrate-binding protein [Mesorhizobium tianshanense]|uniref:Molybdate transport system substrate-binding protein n=1 Tax=Mesorhizobium tianshanense TaxID=39844 RepID=A0A562NN28_9HYPH|nr:molybdate ABC transporter substrate-binding protein [Mesorhizobium tianshanense]TWI33619.1 molybdate transport system substrate-binding protein [Mesorhizobium tianshanense]GLS41442.1 molybdate ABC transporter substrate-binding protein [Mesorhizobium tianshanense]
MLVRKGFGLKAAAIGGLATMLIAAMPAAHADDRLIVFAAASMKNALDAVNTACEADVGEAATISYAASSALAKQIEGGAPADIFISADLDWMKYLSDKKLIKPDTEVKLLGNEIVLVAPKDSTAETKIEKRFDLARLIGESRLAMGDSKAVPAGKYAKAALEELGVWSSVEGKVAQAENVRAALKLVSTGEAALGIVYATDAHAEPGVKVIGTFPEDSHPPIVYPVAQTADSKDKDAPAFLKCLQSVKAGELFKAQDFTVLTPSN